MKDVHYTGILSEDIKNTKIKDKKSDIIVANTAIDVIAILIGIPIVYSLNRLFKVETNWITCISFLTAFETTYVISHIKKAIKNRKENVDKSISNIDDLADKLNCSDELVDKYANNYTPTINADNITNAVTTKDKIVEKNVEYNDSDIAKSIKTIITDFYMLDSENQLKVLREIRKNIKTKDYTIKKNNLYLLEEDDIPKELPIKKVLEKK